MTAFTLKWQNWVVTPISPTNLKCVLPGSLHKDFSDSCSLALSYCLSTMVDCPGCVLKHIRAVPFLPGEQLDVALRLWFLPCSSAKLYDTLIYFSDRYHFNTVYPEQTLHINQLTLWWLPCLVAWEMQPSAIHLVYYISALQIFLITYHSFEKLSLPPIYFLLTFSNVRICLNNKDVISSML